MYQKSILYAHGINSFMVEVSGTGFYMIGTSVMKRLNLFHVLSMKYTPNNFI